MASVLNKLETNDFHKNEIISKEVPAITIEASSVCSWEKYSKNNMGIETFGESAPLKEVYKHFNLTSVKIVELTKKLIKKYVELGIEYQEMGVIQHFTLTTLASTPDLKLDKRGWKAIDYNWVFKGK